MVRTAAVLMLSALTGLTAAVDDARASVLKIFAESQLTLTESTWAGMSSRERELTIGRHGSAFVVHDTAGDPILITAAHVVTGPLLVGTVHDGDDKLVVDGDDVRLDEHHLRVRIGELALHPAALLVDHEADVALLRLRPEDRHLLGVTPLELADSTPSTGVEIEAWGYPRQVASPQLLTGLRVSDVQDGFFVLNRPLEPGTSGGPALVNGEACGVVVRSAEAQTRCASMEAIKRLLGSAPESWKGYSDGLGATEVAAQRPAEAATK